MVGSSRKGPRLGAVPIAVMALVALAAPVAAADPVVMTTETLVGTTPGTTTGDCRTDDTVVFDYSISGTAAGPYPGTFTETGRLTLRFVTDPSLGRLGIEPLVGNGFTAAFQIDGPTDVTGDKSPLVGRSNFVFCGASGDLVFPGGTNLFSIGARYTATIHHAAGTYRDAGFTDVSFLTVAGGVLITERFGLSDFVTPPQVLPTTKEACKEGAYADYDVFKNQGQCMKFVRQ